MDLERDLSLHNDNIKALFPSNYTDVRLTAEEIIAINGFGKPVSFSVKYELNLHQNSAFQDHFQNDLATREIPVLS